MRETGDDENGPIAARDETKTVTDGDGGGSEPQSESGVQTLARETEDPHLEDEQPPVKRPRVEESGWT